MNAPNGMPSNSMDPMAMRSMLVGLVRAFESKFGPLDELRAVNTSIASKLVKQRTAGGSSTTTYKGLYTGKSFGPRIDPKEADLDKAFLGETATVEGASSTTDAEDVELWDISRIEGGIIAHLAGQNADGKPVLFMQSPFIPVLVSITSDASGGGKYNGKIVKPTFTAASASGTLAIGDYGVLPTAADCLVFNMSEKGKLTHDLGASKEYMGYLIPKWSDAGLPVVIIGGFEAEDCT